MSPLSFLKSERRSDKDINKNKFDKESLIISNNTIVECTEDLFKSSDDYDAMVGKLELFDLEKMEKEKIKEEKKEKDLTDLVDLVEIKESIKHEGELYKFSKKDGKVEVKSFYLTVIDQSIYYYRRKDHSSN